MSRTIIPFEHRDVSSLAKFLRSGLEAKNVDVPKHTEMLNLLARSRGFRNYAAYKASIPEESNNKDRLVVLELINSQIAEYYKRDADGKIVDRRHHTVDQIQFTMNVKIELGHARTDVVVHALGRGASWSFSPEYEPDRAGIAKSALHELGESLSADSVDLFRVHEVGISLSKMGREGGQSYGNEVEVFRVSANQYTILEEAVALANSATTQCEKIVEWMQEVSRTPELAMRNKACIREALNHLDTVIECSGEPFMHGWNIEKATSIRHIMTKWAEGKQSNKRDRDYVFRNLFVFNAPPSWTNQPPEIGPALEAATT